MSSAPTRRSFANHGYLLAGLCVFFLAINVQYLLKVINSDRPDSKSAFLRWTPQVREANEGVNVWEKSNWPNPPIMLMILTPFMSFTPIMGAWLWFLAKVACAIASIFMVFLMLDRPDRPFPMWGKALAVLLSLRPIEGDLVHGNVNLFILLTVVAAVYSFTCGRDVAAGLWLALGIACKVTPALFIPYFVWKRAWKTLAATTLGLGLFLFVVPGAYFGWNRNVEYLGSWFNGMVRPFIEKNEVTSEHQNQSLPGLLERMLRERPAFTVRGEENYEPEPDGYYHFAELSSRTLSLAVKGCALVFCLLVMWRFRAPRADRADWRWVAEFAAVTLGMLIFSERTWKHHAVTLLLPFAVLAYQLSAFRLSTGVRNYLVTTVVAVVVLMLTTTSGIFDSQDVYGKLAQVYGAYTWSFLLLLASMLFLAGRTTDDPPRDGNTDAPTETRNIRAA